MTDHKWIALFSGIPQVQNTMNSLDQGLKKTSAYQNIIGTLVYSKFLPFFSFSLVFSVIGFCRCL